MEAGGNSKGWISGGTVEGRWQSALEEPVRGKPSSGGDVPRCPGRSSTPEAKVGFWGHQARGRTEGAAKRRTAGRCLPAGRATAPRAGRRNADRPSRAGPAPGKAPAAPAPHVPAEIPPQRLSARRKSNY